ncbi:MAG: ubiquitin-like domain-containing protein, partial [Anaerovoracaceae bacterium]|nr:ubiquitin-like domain-containing protein [Anaerovoracaceae bacterium]
MTDETRNIEKVLLKLLDGCDRLSGRIKGSKAGIFVGTHKAAKALLTILLVAGVCAGSYALTHIHKQVTVIIKDNPGQRTITYDTTARQIQDFLETEDVDFVPSEDVVLNNQAEFLKNGTTITIEKPIDVYLTADGETLTFSAQPPFTVQDVLDGLGKELGEEDILNFDLTDELKMEDEI